jgi:hypothetical protein
MQFDYIAWAIEHFPHPECTASTRAKHAKPVSEKLALVRQVGREQVEPHFDWRAIELPWGGCLEAAGYC